ncbi:MAG: MerR family transcriptional regulator [Promethearchaeota archaeon]
MQILKATISEIKHFRTYIFQFQYHGKKLYAHPLFEEWNVEDIFASKALILKFGKNQYILGYNGFCCERWIEYMMGEQIIIREYENGNLAGFRKEDIKSVPAVLNYQDDLKILSFDRQVFSLDLEDLSARYLVKMQSASKITIRLLLNSSKFCTLSGVPRETLRHWIIIGKINPAKTENHHPFFSPEQVAQAKILHNSLSNSAEIMDLILQAVQHLENDTIVHLNFFKQLVPNYNQKRYSTLRLVLQRLLAEKVLRRTNRCYYKIINKKN